MMNQFEVFNSCDGTRWLTIINTHQCDFWIGFRIPIKRLLD